MVRQIASETEAEQHWIRWVMQTSRNWDDIADVVRRTSIDIIDDDHQKLTELTLQINNLLDASKEGRFSLEAIEKQRYILESLYVYAEHHFLREEDLIEKLGLPDREIQSKQHEIFLNMLRKALDDFNQGRLTVSIHLRQWILEWWVNHINKVDYHTFQQENLIERVLARPETWTHLVLLIKPTGVEVIDAEHRRLIRVASQWVNALQSGQDGLASLMELEHCASEHFQNEERLIVQHGLPGIDEQRTLHANFLKNLRSLSLSKVADPVESVRLILNWWISHINEADSISFSADHLGESVFDDAVNWEQLSVFVMATGVDLIDAEHRVIAEKMLSLEESSDIQGALAKLDEMIALAMHHFSDEELLMARKGSPLLRVHADNHLMFLDMVRGYRNDLEHDRLQISRGLKRHLLMWWVRHIREYDIPAFMSRAA